MRNRIVFIFIFFVFLWSGMMVKAISVQILPNPRLQKLQARQFRKAVKLNARRGAIYDRNGVELAVTVPSHSLFADPKYIEDPKQFARRLAPLLRMNRKVLYRKVKNPKRRFVWLRRQMDEDFKNRVEKLNLKGLGFIKEPKRIYPHRKLASPLIGFVGVDDKGLEGLELKYDDYLRGKDSKLSYRKDAYGRPLLKDGRIFTANPDGSSLHLTIDSELQFVLEKELNEVTDQHDADAAVGVILDVQTSEIIAMASTPGYDLNKAKRYVSSVRRNRAVTDAFEPGSTIKTFIVAAALQNRLVKPSTRINCEGGELRVGRHTISEADAKHRFDYLTVAEVLAKSSNVGAAKLAFMLKDRRAREALSKFGFGRRSGVDMPGEGRGILHKTPWKKHLLSNVSFGHGVTATALQMANAYAAIANGGILNTPHILRRVTNKQSNAETNIPKKKGQRIMSEELASTMRLILGNVTALDSVSSARVRGYPVAGKTGTAQKVNPKGRGYLPGQYISSFAGFLPTNNPKYVIYVAVDNPKKQYYGSQVVAPVFSRVGEYAMRRALIPPVLIDESTVVNHAQHKSKPAKVKLKGKRSKTSIARIALQQKAKYNRLVPPLEGLTLREVLQKMQPYGIKVKVSGSGRVVRSSPQEGKKLGRSLRLVLKN